MKKISIITSVYNRKDTILDTINSIIHQDYKNIEYIIIDANSNDGTSEIIKKIKNKNFIYINEPDNGIYDGLNKGIKTASGEIIGILHSDDVFATPKTISNIMNNVGDFDIIYGNCNFLDHNLKKIKRKWQSSNYSLSKLKLGWMPPHTAIFFKKTVFENVGLYSTQYSISSDYDFILKSFLHKSHKIKYLNETIVNMRIGGISNNNLYSFYKKLKEDIHISKKYSLSIFSLLFKRIRKINQFL